MIPEKAIREAIDETEALPDSYDKAKKLATFYTLLDHLYPEIIPQGYSGETYPDTSSDFMQAVKTCDESKVWDIIDELMETLATINPRLYDGVMRRLREA